MWEWGQALDTSLSLAFHLDHSFSVASYRTKTYPVSVEDGDVVVYANSGDLPVQPNADLIGHHARSPDIVAKTAQES